MANARQPLGPDDFNQASYYRAEYTSIAIDSALFTSIAIDASGFRMNHLLVYTIFSVVTLSLTPIQIKYIPTAYSLTFIFSL